MIGDPVALGKLQDLECDRRSRLSSKELDMVGHLDSCGMCTIESVVEYLIDIQCTINDI